MHHPKMPPEIRRVIPAGQQFITFIRRHLIGLIYIYLAVAAGVVALIVIAAAVAPDLLEGITGQDSLMLTAASILFIALIVLILILVTNIYRHNSLVITDKETIQVLQKGVFQLKVSHLSHADVEDITFEQNGLLASMFNYGTLHIETAGELRNFVFTYCPDPERYARIILEARQKFTEPTSG